MNFWQPFIRPAVELGQESTCDEVTFWQVLQRPASRRGQVHTDKEPPKGHDPALSP